MRNLLQATDRQLSQIWPPTVGPRLEALVSDDAGLGQAIHPFPNVNVDPSILNERQEFVLVDNLWGNDVDR
jgi:hypothetical protein